MDTAGSNGSKETSSGLDAAGGAQLSIEAHGSVLSAVAHLPARVPAPVIVCSHGLFSAKESPKFIALCEAFCRAGFCALRFDFSGCGKSPRRSGPGLVDGRKRDLAAAIAFALKQPWSDGRIGLFGSSLGGYLSLLEADTHPELLCAVVSWSAPFEVGAKHGEELSAMYPEGLGSPTNLAGLTGAGRVLLVHGQSDEVVPWRDSVRIYRRLKDPKKLLLLRTADHRISNASWRNTAIRETVEWFLVHISGAAPF
ncbi:MAG: alpha/beta fold hydrolase [Syntrophobacteraceae bacterium]|nr:alpha/beta fold hydrolase [Syntrophobacteraceae bacterium]